MPLWHFLYRCPDCGADPVEGEEDLVRCRSCGLRCERGPDGEIRLVRAGGTPTRSDPEELARRIEALGGPDSRARASDGRLRYRSQVELRRARREVPLRWGGNLGFYEVVEEGEPGTLEVTDDHLTFRPEGGGRTLRWALLDLGSLQASSSSIQVRAPGLELAIFVFPHDSPRRWEELLKGALARAWERAGRGSIVEFQPRITSG